MSGAMMIGWDGTHGEGKRPYGIHPLASVGGPPESRTWMVGDPMNAPQIASSALIHAFCTIDAGLPEAQTTTIGERTFLQARVHVGHNAVVGADCELCAGVVICGHVRIGNGVRIGGNSWVKPRVRIGDGAIIGGGSVVTKDVPAFEVWAGNPARFLKLADAHPGLGGAVVPDLYLEQQRRDVAEKTIQANTYIGFVAKRSFPTADEIAEHMGYGAFLNAEQWEREKAQSGFRPPAEPPTPDWLRGIS